MINKIHLICGFMGFGKTTLAKKLEEESCITRFSCDEYLTKLISKFNQDDIFDIYQKALENTWNDLEKEVVNNSVSFDASLWSSKDRALYNQKAIDLVGKKNVVWHHLICDVNIAKERLAKRNLESDYTCFFITEKLFDKRFPLYEIILKTENLNEINYIQS